MLCANLDKAKPFSFAITKTYRKKWHKLFLLTALAVMLEPHITFAALVNNGADGAIGWDSIAGNSTVAGNTTGQAPGGVIAVTHHLSSGFNIYAKNNADPSSTNFTMRNTIAGMTGANGASYVRILASNGYTPQWLELRANEGIFDLSSIKVGSADTITANTYDFTLQALDSSFNPIGTAVTLSGIAKSNYGTFSVASNTDFDGIYGVRLTVNTGLQIAVDDIEITSPRMPDTPPPTVTSISSSTLNGTYKVGSPISIQVNFDEIVYVTGTPQLTLETGATDRTINYTSGTGSSTLTFTYNVQAGDVSADLDYTTTTALALNSGTIRDAAGNNATLTLPTPGAANSLGANKSIVIDGVMPRVTSVNSDKENGTWKIGTAISVQVNFSKAVTVTGTPQLTLETGATDQTINYASGTGTSTLTFSYTVQPGDNSNDLDYVDLASLNLNSGTIRDAAGNDAALTLPTPGAANSLGANKSIVIDGVVPSVSSIVVSGSPTAAATSVNFTVTFSESVSNVTTEDFALGITATANGTIASVSGSGSIYTVTVTGIAGNGSLKVNLNASTDIIDAAGNAGPATFTGGTTHAVSIINNSPSIGNLNLDDVRWPDVGNTVTLDSGGDATVADTELDAANWNGASLTVQRNVGGTNTPINSDVFSFNESGYTLSGGDLQTGGTTFGTFTNTNGVLSISFNANATNTLVRDVVRGIQYRNDTPAGDTTIRFTLSDGTTSTAADVVVTSDSIYVTNPADTATINLANGVSFSEAIAIAAADLTDNQTIVIASSLATQTVSTSAVSTLNENLTLNLNSASGVTLSGGSLAIAPGVALTVTNGATDTTTFTTALTGSGSFTKLGTGTMVLNGTSTTYTGLVTVGQGVLTVAHNNALGTTVNGVTVSSDASLRVANGITITDALNLYGSGFNASGALQLAAGSATVSGNIELSTTSVRINSAGTLSLSGMIGGTNLASTGTGSLILSGTNHYGNTTVSAGTLSVASDNHLGFTQITLASGTTLAVTGATTIDNGITLTGAATISNTANVTLDGVISGGHNLTKTGSGVLTLARDNAYAATNVDAGTLSVSSDSNLGSDAITMAAGTTLVINGATTIDNPIALTGAATISNSATATIDGVISGAHNLTKTGSATLTLAASNTYSGNTIVSTGGLTLTGGSSIGDGSAVSVASGATLTLAGGSETIGALLGDGNVVLGDSLTTGGNNVTTTFSGVISGTGNGISKIGTGAFTLSGSNTYTGSTTVSAGTLALSGGAAISDASTVTVSSGATLSLNATETLGALAGAGNVSLNGFTLSSGGNNTNTTFSGALGGSGGFTKTGSGTLTLSGSNSGTFTGGTTVSGNGTLSVASDDNLGSGTLSLNNGTLVITGATTIDNSISLTNGATISNTSAVTLSGAISGSGSLAKAGSGLLSLSGTSNYGGSTTVTAGTLSVGGALTGTSAVSVSAGATLTGSGSVTNLVVNNSGTLSPGNSAGVFTVDGNLQMVPGSTLAIEINGETAGTEYDQVIVNGLVSVAGNLVASHGYSAGNGDIYTIIVNDMAHLMTGTFSGLAEGATITAGDNGTVLTASYIGGTGNDFTLTAPLNAAPVIANLNGDTVNFIENSDLVLLDANSDATVTDSDSVDFDGGNVTVAIVNNRVNAEDVLSIRNQGTAGGQIGTSGLNITYGGTVIGTRTADGGTDSNDLVITLNSAATPAIIQALVRNLTYINTNTTEPTTATRSVEVTVNDGDGGTSSGATIDVVVVAVNDAPTLATTSATPTFTEGGLPVSLFSGTSVSTVESGQLITMLTVTVTNVTDGSDEVIHFDGTNIPLVNGFTDVSLIHGVDISVAVTGSTATLTFVRADGLSSAQTAVDGMTYKNTSISPTVANRVITITALQDNGGTADDGVDTSAPGVSATVTTSAVYSVPVVTTSVGITAFTEGNNVASTPVAIDAGITVSDIDSSTLASASVSISTGFQLEEDSLGITLTADMGNIAAAYTSSTGILTLTSANATATLAQWEAALAAVTYTNSSEAPLQHIRQISFVVNDGQVASVVVTKTVSVTAVNDAPLITGTPASSVNQDVAYSFIPTASDVDVGDVLTFSISNKPAWASFDSATGALTGTPTSADVVTTTGIVISVSDGGLSVSLTAFDLTVVNVNDAPVISGVPASSVNQDVAYSFIPTASDVDEGDVLTFSVSNKPAWASFDTATGALTGTPTNANVGTTSGIVISVSDGDLVASLAAFNLTVTNVNDAPLITGTPATSVNQDVAYSFIPTASDIDVGDVLTFSINNKPAWASFDPATGTLTGTPTNADVGTTSGIVISVSDGDLVASLTVFNLTVTNVNDAPLITGVPATSVNQDAAFSFIPTASDVDVGDTLTFSISNKPAWASFDTATGALTGTPTNADVGTTSGIVISVSDGGLSVSLTAFDLTVVNVNDAPVISGVPASSVNQDVAYSFIPTASDIDVGDVLTFSISNKPAWASFDTATGALTGTPVRADVGTTAGIEITVTDGTASTSLAAFDLTVVLVNAAPVISGTPATQVDRGAAYSFVPSASDDDGDTLTFSATGLPSWLSVDAATGEVSGTAPIEAIGESYAIELTVSDGTESDSLSWNLSVVLQIGDITGLWLQDGEASNDRFGGALALFDATGDGLAEVYVGSPTRTVTVANKKLKNAGGVDILAPGNGALLQRINAAVAKQRFGSAIAVIADQNNDGFEDLIVGKPFAGAGGEIALHSGDDGSLIRTLVKGEGKAASPIVSIMPLCAIDPQHIVCRILGSSEQGGRIGYSVAVADVDGNGGADLIVGLPQANVKTPVKLNKAGSVIVYQGLTDTPRYVVNGTQAGERFGSSVAADSNYLLVGSPNFDVQAAKKLKDAGRVQLLNLQDGSAAGSTEGTAAKQLLGSAVASFNQDVNADGEPDWAAAAAGDKSGVPVKLFSGVTAPVQFAEIAVTAPRKVDAIRLASGMDINGDGVSDLVIGMPNTKVTVPFNNKTKTLNNAGQVQVISGANWAP